MKRGTLLALMVLTVHIEYLFLGENSDFKYHDIELAVLFNEVDNVPSETCVCGFF